MSKHPDAPNTEAKFPSLRIPTILFILLPLLILSVADLDTCEKNASKNSNRSREPIPGVTMNNLSDQQIEELYSMPVAPVSGFTFPRSVVGVSSYNSDCKPSITANGRQLYFISQDNNGPGYGGEQYGNGFNIYVARWNGTEWDSVTNLGPDINPAAYACISADGRTLYLTKYPNIYVSTFVDTAWTTPTALPPPVNVSGSIDKAPFITPDGHQLYFSSERTGGYGGDDLYVVRWNGTAWDSLTNLGAPVNTDAAEAHPAVVEGSNGLELYFSDFGGSRATWKFGGMDIYVSGWTGSGWGPPLIVGAPINSDHPLCSIFPTGDGGFFLGSGVHEGSRGEEDIWTTYPDTGSVVGEMAGLTLDTDWTVMGDLEGAWNVLCLIEARDGTLYAGTAPNGDVFRSDDRGATWENTQNIPGAMQVYSLHEASDSTLYTGTYPYGDVFWSRDRGDHWLPTADIPWARSVRGLLETSHGYLLAAVSPDSLEKGMIYRSTDHGSSWERTGLLNRVEAGMTALMEGDDGVIFASGRVWDDRIFYSLDAGSTWADIDLPYDNGDVSVAYFPYLGKMSNGDLWVGGWAHGPQGVLARSTNNGVSWDTTATVMNGDVEVALFLSMVEESDNTLLIGYHPGPDSVVMRSTDYGETWKSAGHLPGAYEVLCLLKTRSGHILAGTSPDGKIYRRKPAPFEYDGKGSTAP